MTHGRQPKQLNKAGGEAEVVQREAGLQHRLSPAQVAMIALGSTIGTGLFLTSAISVKLAGPAGLFGFWLGALINPAGVWGAGGDGRGQTPGGFVWVCFGEVPGPPCWVAS